MFSDRGMNEELRFSSYLFAISYKKKSHFETRLQFSFLIQLDNNAKIAWVCMCSKNFVEMQRHGSSIRTILFGFCSAVFLSCVFAASSTYTKPFPRVHSLNNTTRVLFEPKTNVGFGVERILLAPLLLPLLLLIPLLLPLLLLIPLLSPLLLLIPLLLPLLLLIPFFFSIFFPATAVGRSGWEKTLSGNNFEKFLQDKMVNLPEDISRIVEKIRSKTKVSMSMTKSSSADNARSSSKGKVGVTRNRQNKAVYTTGATSSTLPNRTF